jgi:hypothetical protein
MCYVGRFSVRNRPPGINDACWSILSMFVVLASVPMHSTDQTDQEEENELHLSWLYEVLCT